jgi:hypothetical protein
MDEFHKVCRLNNLGLNASEITILHGHFDTNKDGGVNYDEFLRAVRGRLAPVRKQIVSKIFNVLDKCAARSTRRALAQAKPLSLSSLTRARRLFVCCAQARRRARLPDD